MTKKLKGFLQSGILYIGDPSYMAGDMSQPDSEKIIDLTNPFRNWDSFTDSINDEDAVLPFPGTVDSGRGIAIQTHRLSGQYEVSRIEDADGKLLELKITFKD